MIQKKRIILVDDNMINLSIGKHMLGESYSLLTVPSGEKLFEALRRMAPDLILMDVDMPDMNGFEILAKLKEDERYQSIPVVFLSARDDIASHEKGFALGAADFVAKPYLPQHLIAHIDRLLLIEAQKKTLLDNQQMLLESAAHKRQSIIELQNAILSTLVIVAESRSSQAVLQGITGGTQIGKSLDALMHEAEGDAAYRRELGQWDSDLFTASARFHDIGKIIVKDQILLKPSRLTPAEFAQMQKHTLYGVQLIESIERKAAQVNFFSSAKLFASSHHERWDGSGYPNGLRGEAIPLQGRMMAIVDVYNALVSERSYKAAVSPREARAIIAQGRGTLFDPHLTDIFLSLPIP